VPSSRIAWSWFATAWVWILLWVFLDVPSPVGVAGLAFAAAMFVLRSLR
jgi:hypothetical protein